MRTRLSLRFAALLLIMLTCGLGILPAGAQQATPSADQTAAFTALRMISPTDGWAVVTVPDSGGFSNAVPGDVYAGNLAYILHTHDGGQRWTNVTSTPPIETLLPAGGYGCDCSDNGIAGFFFLDSDHAWEMIDDAGFPDNQAFGGISVRSTSDGGQTWQTSIDGMDAPYVITSDFIDPQHGWLLIGGIPPTDSGDQPALLFQTIDGGLHWHLIADDGTYPHMSGSAPNPADPISPLATGITPLNHTGMVFESKASGWMLVDEIDGDQSHMLHTANGGVTWEKVTGLDRLKGDPSCSLNLLTIDPPGAITFLAGCYAGDVIIHSPDDGKTWQGNPVPANLLNLHGWPQLFMLNSTTGWALGCDASAGSDACDASAPTNLYTTSDAGAAWSKVGSLPSALQPVTADYIETDPRLDFVDDQTGWAIAPAGRLFTTRDGGTTWSLLQPSITGI